MNRKLRGACRLGPMVQRVRDALARAKRESYPDGVLSAPWLEARVWDAMADLANHSPDRAAALRVELGFGVDRPKRTSYQLDRVRWRTPRWWGRPKRDKAYETDWIRRGTKKYQAELKARNLAFEKGARP